MVVGYSKFHLNLLALSAAVARLFASLWFFAIFAVLSVLARTCFLFKAHWAKRFISRQDAKCGKDRKDFSMVGFLDFFSKLMHNLL